MLGLVDLRLFFGAKESAQADRLHVLLSRFRVTSSKTSLPR